MFKSAIIIVVLYGQLLFSQNIDRLEFESYNTIIIDSKINIILEPLKNNKRGKIRVQFQSKKNSFTKRIPKNGYAEISNAVLKIKEQPFSQSKDSISTKCLDGSDIFITTFSNTIKKQYHMDCISDKDKYDEYRKDFWYASKLILETVKMRNEDLY
jgi:hypothetical protein